MVDPAVPGLARLVAESDRAFEHVIVVFVRRIGRIGSRQIEQVAQLGQEQRKVGALRPEIGRAHV